MRNRGKSYPWSVMICEFDGEYSIKTMVFVPEYTGLKFATIDI